METTRCLKFALPFLDGPELALAETTCKGVQLSAEQLQLWEVLCQAYAGRDFQTRRRERVPVPDRDGDTAKDYFDRLYELSTFVAGNDVVRCLECTEWSATELNALECEMCRRIWCDQCARRGLPKSELSCDECPDFSTHCWECFLAGKSIQCMCCGTDSWHYACGRHAVYCNRCERYVCNGCTDQHSYSCSKKIGEADEEDEEDEDGEDEDDE
ncbi:unnamed protein product [Symbiodinium natans]|uniref:Uncharacterized protein n=1 Tax=Symbiodinium natans TaxID=878477 RepID=A0A812SUC6_9DINO|nr:unnamed protein product [Symbiodinium natans]